jgi:hypothetical protein
MSTSADPSPLQETPPARALLRFITGYMVSRAIYVMAKLGIADLLRDGPQDGDGLAQTTGTDARAPIGCCAPWSVSGCSSKTRPRALG